MQNETFQIIIEFERCDEIDLRNIIKKKTTGFRRHFKVELKVVTSICACGDLMRVSWSITLLRRLSDTFLC